jgi:hypothetical protein
MSCQHPRNNLKSCQNPWNNPETRLPGPDRREQSLLATIMHNSRLSFAAQAPLSNSSHRNLFSLNALDPSSRLARLVARPLQKG